MKDREPTLVVPTTTNWEIERGGGMEKFIRSLAHEAFLRRKPVAILSTGTRALNNGPIEICPIAPSARTELAYVRALRRKLRTRQVSLPAAAAGLANAEASLWPLPRSPAAR